MPLNKREKETQVKFNPGLAANRPRTTGPRNLVAGIRNLRRGIQNARLSWISLHVGNLLQRKGHEDQLENLCEVNQVNLFKKFLQKW